MIFPGHVYQWRLNMLWNFLQQMYSNLTWNGRKIKCVLITSVDVQILSHFIMTAHVHIHRQISCPTNIVSCSLPRPNGFPWCFACITQYVGLVWRRLTCSQSWQLWPPCRAGVSVTITCGDSAGTLQIGVTDIANSRHMWDMSEAAVMMTHAATRWHL